MVFSTIDYRLVNLISKQFLMVLVNSIYFDSNDNLPQTDQSNYKNQFIGQLLH